jgi:hypothetical protein
MKKDNRNFKKTANRYVQIIEKIFLSHFKQGAEQFIFSRDEIEHVAKRLGIRLPKNLGDVIYSFRYRVQLPRSVREKAPAGKQWIIKPAGQAKYRFLAAAVSTISPSINLVETKVPDATPGIISMYALGDEQALLAKLRYNRLLDIFSGVTCYSLQNHLRTKLKDLGQMETDEVYIGVDKRGAHYVFPVQAKGHKDRISVVQIEQDLAMCATKFPRLICRPIAAQFMSGDLIALFEFERGNSGIAICSEKHYRLVEPDEINAGDLESYRLRQPE